MDLFDSNTFYYTLSFATASIILVLAVMLLAIHVPSDKRLSNFRFAKRYLSFSYFILAVSGFIGFFSQQEADDRVLLVTCTLIIASYQALLFTYTILALIQPLYIKQKNIIFQLTVITIVAISLLAALYLLPHLLFSGILYISIVGYFLQIIYYTYIFRLRYNICIDSLEDYYDDDEHNRLNWVRFSFYSALLIGILALSSLFFNIYFHIIFSILYTVYYAYMVCRFYNYQIDFKFAIPVITTDKNKNVNNDNALSDLAEESIQFKKILEQWVENKQFTQKDISVDEIAQSLGVNRSFLQYYFRTYMHTDFRTWRSELRIVEAQNILKENPEISLNKVHESVGFNHRANFHQQFQKITGLTPTEYKQQQAAQS